MSSSLPFQNIKLGSYSLSSIGFTLGLAYAGRSSWEGQGDTPNSKTILYMPGINILIGSENGGGFGINIVKGYEHYFNENSSDIDETNDIYAITINYRTVLDRIIEKLY